MKLSIFGVAVVAVVSSGFAAVSTSLDVRQPLRNSTYVEGQGQEVAGPRSVVKVFVPAGLSPEFLTAGQPIDRARLEGLDSNGGVIGSVAISETILEAPAYDNASGNLVTLELSASANLPGFFANGDLASVRLRVTTADRDPVTDGVETEYLPGSEAQDECLDVDDDSPQLVAAYRDDDNVLYLQFNEPMANGNPDNSENQTNQQFVNATDLQVNSEANFFSAATPTLSGEFVLISGYADDAGRTILSYQLNSDTFAFAGNYIRATADDFGNPTHNVYRDVAGNDAFQQGEPGIPTVEGVQIQAGPPPGVGGSLFWVGGAGPSDFNAPTNWLPNGAPTYTTDTRLNITGATEVSFTEPATAARSLWTDGFVQMRVADDNNPFGILYLTGQESFGGVFTKAFLLQDAFNPEVTPTSIVSLTDGVIDAESVGFRQNFSGSILLELSDAGELWAGSVEIGAPGSTGSSQLFAVNGGRLVTGYDNEIGARSTQSPSVIINDSGIVETVLGGGWHSMGDVVVNSGGQILIAADGGGYFFGSVQLNGDAIFFAEDAFVVLDVQESAPGTYLFNNLLFQDNGLFITQRMTVESGRTLEPPELTVGLLGPESSGVAVFDQLIAKTGASVGATNFFTVSFDGRVLLPDFDGNSALPLEEQEAFITLQGGTLELRFADGFDPPLGSEFPLISASNFSGQFANHILPSFDDGRVAVVQYPIPRAGNGIVYQGAVLRIVDLASLLGFNPDPDVTNIANAPVRADAGDLDGDGDIDLAVVFDAGGESGSVAVLLNAGTVEGVWQGFDQAVQFATGPKPTAIAIGDYTNDVAPKGQSDLDLAVVCSGDNSLRVYLNTGNGDVFESVANVPTEAFPTDVEAVDFNADGFTDLAVVCKDADVVQIFLNSGSGAALLGGIFQAPSNVAAGDEPVDCDPVDLDNDKDIDLATGGLSGGVSTSSNDGEGGFGTTGNAQTGNPVDAVASGDLDGDLDFDTAVVSRETGLLSILINIEGTLELFSTFSVGSDARALTIIDYDLDGDADISVVSVPEGDTVRRVTVLRNDTQPDGPLVFTPSVELTNEGDPSDPKVIYSVDVDGDGRPDIVTVDDQVKGEGGVVSSYLNVSGPVPLCAGDANKDRRVDGKDLQSVLGSFGQPAAPLTGANMNGDGIVDGRDLSVVLANYGNECELPTAGH